MDLVKFLVFFMFSFDCLFEDFCKDDCFSFLFVIDKVNLDIIFLIIFVFSVINGGCYFDFLEKVLVM